MTREEKEALASMDWDFNLRERQAFVKGYRIRKQRDKKIAIKARRCFIKDDPGWEHGMDLLRKLL